MTSHTLAVIFLVGWAFQFALVAVDDQPKPSWTKVYKLRVVLSLCVIAPAVLWLAIRAL